MISRCFPSPILTGVWGMGTLPALQDPHPPAGTACWGQWAGHRGCFPSSDVSKARGMAQHGAEQQSENVASLTSNKHRINLKDWGGSSLGPFTCSHSFYYRALLQGETTAALNAFLLRAIQHQWILLGVRNIQPCYSAPGTPTHIRYINCCAAVWSHVTRHMGNLIAPAGHCHISS